MDSPVESASDHIVHFYDAESELLDGLADYVGGGFKAGDRVIAIATHAHLAALEERLIGDGHDVGAARARGDYLPLNAAETLSRFMVNGRPHPERFRAAMERVLKPAGAKPRARRAFGEMVAILWAEGNAAAAIELETLWNELIAREKFQLLCAYPMPRFRRESARAAYAHVCALHSRLIPALA